VKKYREEPGFWIKEMPTPLTKTPVKTMREKSSIRHRGEAYA